MNSFRDKLTTSFASQSTKIIAKKLAQATVNTYLGKEVGASLKTYGKFNRQRVLEMAYLCRLAYIAYEQIPITVTKLLTSGQLFPKYKFKTVDFLYNDSSLLTDENYPVCCGYITSTPKEIFVVLRGTRDIKDWLINLLVNTNPQGIHSGFAAYADSIWAQLHKIGIFSDANSHQKKLILVGHSLGGAGVTLLAHKLSCQSFRMSLFEQVEVYTFGCPPVSTAELILDASVYWIRNSADLIPHIPKFVSLIGGWHPYISESLCKYQYLLPEYVIHHDYQIYQLDRSAAKNLWNSCTIGGIFSQLQLDNNIDSFEKLIISLIRCFHTEHRLLSYIEKLNYGLIPHVLNSMALSDSANQAEE